MADGVRSVEAGNGWLVLGELWQMRSGKLR